MSPHHVPGVSEPGVGSEASSEIDGHRPPTQVEALGLPAASPVSRGSSRDVQALDGTHTTHRPDRRPAATRAHAHTEGDAYFLCLDG